jgi:predicted ABC-type sugar transport system permease subunit
MSHIVIIAAKRTPIGGFMGGLKDVHTVDQGWELTAIASALIGGTSLSGGRGNIVGALLGALLLSMLQNVLTLLNVQAFYQLLATDGIIIGAMFLDRLGRRDQSQTRAFLSQVGMAFASRAFTCSQAILEQRFAT